MTNGLVGYSGFVGASLDRQMVFDRRYNSLNSRDMAGQHFDLLVCAAAPSVKWLANRHPEADRRQIADLKDVLGRVTADEFVLISTIDVYPDPGAGGDEMSAIDPSTHQPYGRHRLELEHWVAATFPKPHVIRLPALFGPGLKKNALFDLLHDNEHGAAINPAAVYQWYPLRRLAADIETIRRGDLAVVNLVIEPLDTSRLIAEVFPAAATGPASRPAPAYRMKTRHDRLLGGRDGFVLSAEHCLLEIRAFVSEQRGGLKGPARTAERDRRTPGASA